MNKTGSSLVWFLFIVLLFMMLGISLMNFAQSDLRVSGHLLQAGQAQFAADAGIERAIAVLGPLLRGLGDDGWSEDRREEPVFWVEARKESEQVLRIRSVGRAGGLTETVEVLANLRPLGRQALVGGELVLQSVQVAGHVTGDQVKCIGGNSEVSKDVRTARLEEVDGGTCTCGGHVCEQVQPYAAEVDFTLLQQEALSAGWALAEGDYRLEGSVAGPIYIQGNVEIALAEAADVFLVADGDVTIVAWAADSRVVVLSSGDVMLPNVGEVWAGSLFVFSNGGIRRSGETALTLNGAMVARRMELEQVVLTYCDEAMLLYLGLLPQKLLELGATFDLVWLDLQPRR